MGIEPADELASARSPQELGALVRNSAKHGGLEESQAKMLDRSLKFGETNAEELMTPRSTIAALDADDTVADLLALALETGAFPFPCHRWGLRRHDRRGTRQGRVFYSTRTAQRHKTALACPPSTYCPDQLGWRRRAQRCSFRRLPGGIGRR